MTTLSATMELHMYTCAKRSMVMTLTMRISMLMSAPQLLCSEGSLLLQIGKDGLVLSFGHSFFTGALPSSYLDNPNVLGPGAALRGARDALQLPLTIDNVSTEAADGRNEYIFREVVGAVSDPKAKLVYLVKPEGTLALTWRIETDMYEHWLLTYIDAETTTVHGVVDYVADATYQV